MNFKFIIKKIIASLATLFLLASVTFFIFEIIPGDVVIAKLGTSATEENVRAMRELYGLDKPLIVRYGQFITGLFSGDFGISYSTSLPVTDMLAESLPVTVSLAVISLIMIIFVSTPVGIFFGALSVKRKNAKKVFAFDIFNQIFMSLPPFIIGIGICLFFGLGFSIIPAAVAIAIPKIAMMVRFIKNSVADEMNKNYVRMARSKGMSETRVLFKHVLKNVVITNITALSVVIVEIFAGSVVVEQVFSLNGLGRLLVACISVRDFRVVSAIVMYIGVVVIAANLISDILYAVVDKRTVSANE